MGLVEDPGRSMRVGKSGEEGILLCAVRNDRGGFKLLLFDDDDEDGIAEFDECGLQDRRL